MIATRTMRGRVYWLVEWPAQEGDIVDWIGPYGRRTHRVVSVRPNDVTIAPNAGDPDRPVRVQRGGVVAIWRRRTDITEEP